MDTDEFPALEDLLSYDVEDEAREARRLHEEQLKVRGSCVRFVVCFQGGQRVGVVRSRLHEEQLTEFL